MTLVSIFGDFHSSVLPIYYNFKNKIKKHIVIYDDGKYDVNEAKNLIKGMKNFNKKHKLDIKMYTHCIDENSYEAILKTIDFIKEHHNKKNALYINTTDGLSNINNLIAMKLLPLGANLLSYDRFENNINHMVGESMKTYKVNNVIPIKDHFLLRNIHIESLGDKKFAKKYKNHILELFEKRLQEFKAFSYYVQTNPNPQLNNSDFKKVNKIINQMEIKELKKNQSLITGGLFEYYIYLKLLKLNFDDIEISVNIQKFIDEINFIPNEFDILIMKDNHLNMIECKFSKRIKLDDIVYKYMGLKPLLDDDGKICIVTTYDEPKNIYSSNNPLKDLAYKRALENKILLKGNPLNNINNFILELKNYFNL